MARTAGLALLALWLGLTGAPAMAIEEPSYRVLRSLGEQMEIREYAPYVVAEVTVPGPAAQAGNQAFPILAGYIFGRNQGERKFAMTAPVTQMPAGPTEGQRMAMTAPVTQQAAGPVGYVVQFVLPSEVALQAAPLPLDERVRLREEPPQRVAVIRYSGFWSEANKEEHTRKLQAALAAAGLATRGEPVLARYNGPMTPWFLRRNEVWLHLAGP